MHLEVGDFLDAHVKDNAIVLVAKKLVPEDQEWFWSKEWQEMEKEADEAINITLFGNIITNVDSFMKKLNNI